MKVYVNMEIGGQYFFYNRVLLTIYGLQQFAKIKIVKVDYFDSTNEIFETLV